MRNLLLWLQESISNHFSNLCIWNINKCWSCSWSSWSCLLNWLLLWSTWWYLFLNIFLQNSTSWSWSFYCCDVNSFFNSYSSCKWRSKYSVFIRVMCYSFLSCFLRLSWWSWLRSCRSGWLSWFWWSFCSLWRVILKSCNIFFLWHNNCYWSSKRNVFITFFH